VNISELTARVRKPLNDPRAISPHNILIAYSDALHTTIVIDTLKASMLSHRLMKRANQYEDGTLWDLTGTQL
jgi:hypothetical protein